jgi:hypothetical protein
MNKNKILRMDRPYHEKPKVYTEVGSICIKLGMINVDKIEWNGKVVFFK